MSSRSLNKVLLIGNLSQDPELRYTPQGTAVCTFSIATNRSWTDQAGQQQEVAEFTRCVAWAKLAELCSKLLAKGKKAYVEGRLQTRTWEAQDHTKRYMTEVVIDNMIVLGGPTGAPSNKVERIPEGVETKAKGQGLKATSGKNKPASQSEDNLDEPIAAEDIPF